jgi:hypothetical protein
MTVANPRILLAFTPEDLAWIRRSKQLVPKYWEGHGAPPLTGDVLRFGGRQFLIQGRAWEHDADGPLLRVFVGGSHAHSDTVFG